MLQQQVREFKRRLWSTFQGHCSLNSRAAFNWRGRARANTAFRNYSAAREERAQVDCGAVTYPLAVFAGVAVVLVESCPWRHREQHFYTAPVSGGAERAASRGSQLTSAREIQPGTALGIGVALPSAVNVLHTPDWLYLTAFMPHIQPQTDQFCVEGYFVEIFFW